MFLTFIRSNSLFHIRIHRIKKEKGESRTRLVDWCTILSPMDNRQSTCTNNTRLQLFLVHSTLYLETVRWYIQICFIFQRKCEFVNRYRNFVFVFFLTIFLLLFHPIEMMNFYFINVSNVSPSVFNVFFVWILRFRNSHIITHWQSDEQLLEMKWMIECWTLKHLKWQKSAREKEKRSREKAREF